MSATLLAVALFAQNGVLQVRELTLSNGMQVWLNEDPSQPIVFGAVLLPLAQVELYGEVGAGGLDIARCLGGLNGGELPQPVEVTVDGHFVAAAQ